MGNWEDYQIDDNGDGDYTDASDLDQDRTHNLVNETTGITEQADPQQSQWASPVYSARGNQTGVPTPSDLTAVYTVTYDAWNRLVEVKSGANVVLKCEYDGLGRRTKKHINTGVDQVYDEFRHFFYNASWQILETRKATIENTGPETLQPEYQYVWSLRYIDAAVLRDENTDEDDLCDDERLYYLTDANMNVTCLVDTGGDAVERYVYDPYGKVTILNGANGVDKDGAVTEWTEDGDQTASDVENSILYCGYFFDDETGLYHVRNRYYHSTLGRWSSRDPIGYVDGMNLYEYVSGSPTNRLDPSGQREVLPVSLQVEKIAGGGSAEVYTGKSGKATVAVGPRERQHGGVLGSVGRAWNRWWQDVDVQIGLVEEILPTEFLAALHVSISADRPRRWQICLQYHWRITVTNRCCMSNEVQLSTASLAEPPATVTAPASRVIPLRVGESENLAVVLSLTVPGGTGKRKFEAQKIESFSGVCLRVSCVE